MKDQYFEGWYFKGSTEEYTIAVIVGEAKGMNEVAFIQIFMSDKVKSYYIPYDAAAFRYREKPLHIQIEGNIFTEHYMKLNIHQDDLIVEGTVQFEAFTRLPRCFFQKGLMGPFAFLPFMECYHDVLSMNHQLKGYLEINGKTYDFQKGKGYIERDWGSSFPSSYMWMQCNQFKKESLSFMLAIANIPFLGSAFTGFLCCISVGGKTRVFATYTGAKIKKFTMTQENVLIEIRQGKEVVHVQTTNKEGSLLMAPNKGAMQRTIYETLEGEIELSVFYEEKLKLYETSKKAAFERVGEPQNLYS